MSGNVNSACRTDWLLSLICDARKGIQHGLPTCQHALCLAPHPDDEVIGCGGLLLQLEAAGCERTILYVTAGQRRRGHEEPGITRLREAEAARHCLGVTRWATLMAPDGGVEASPENVRWVREQLEVGGADLLLLPSPFDSHRDHRITNLLLQQALLQKKEEGMPLLGRVALYEVWTPFMAVNRCIDITEVMDKKVQAIQEYQSQEKRYGLSQMSLHLNAFRGRTTLRERIHYAEGFLEVEIPTFLEMCTLLKNAGWFD